MIGLVVIVLLPLHVLIEGWSVSVLWSWFVVPFGLPAIGLVQAAGLSLLAMVVTHQTKKVDPDEEFPEQLSRYAAGVLTGPLAVLIGWLMRLVAA